MANLYNQKNDENPEGFNPKPDIKDIQAKSSTAATIAWYCTWILIFPIVLHILWRNDFNRRQNRINELASGIDVQLKKRKDTLTKLFEATKGYMAHESSIMKGVAELRQTKFTNANLGESDQMMNSLASRMFAVFENYPELKANESINKLMDSSDYLEREIAASRRLYNSEVRQFNELLFVWPKGVVASRMKLETFPLFKASESDRQDVEIKF